MKKQKFLKGVVFLMATVFLYSCESEDERVNNARINFKGSIHSASSDASARKLNLLEINSLMVNVEEIELEFDDNDPQFELNSVASDFEFHGPFEVDLINNGSGLISTLADATLPVATYDEIEFKIRENENSASEMFGKSIVIKGQIEDLPFVFWTDEEKEFELEFEDNDKLVLDMNQLSVVLVEFDLANLFSFQSGGVDLTMAKDGNGDGLIEIHPGDPDGNSDLADLIWERFEEAIEAFEDKFDN